MFCCVAGIVYLLTVQVSLLTCSTSGVVVNVFNFTFCVEYQSHKQDRNKLLTIVTTQNVSDKITIYVHEIVYLSMGFTHLLQDFSNLTNDLQFASQTER